jgi:HSP20 family protein
MTLIRWNQPERVIRSAWDRLPSLREEMDRLFDLSFNSLATHTPFFSGWVPSVDVYVDKENVIVKTELPGVAKNDIEVSLEDGALLITAERKHETKDEGLTTCRAERGYGKVQRSVSLPTAVVVDQVKATYKDGILTVTLPKAPEAKPKHIEVKIS